MASMLVTRSAGAHEMAYSGRGPIGGANEMLPQWRSLLSRGTPRIRARSRLGSELPFLNFRASSVTSRHTGCRGRSHDRMGISNERSISAVDSTDRCGLVIPRVAQSHCRPLPLARWIHPPKVWQGHTPSDARATTRPDGYIIATQ